jgi:polyisoprenoid-binding protein YceI
MLPWSIRRAILSLAFAPALAAAQQPAPQAPSPLPPNGWRVDMNHSAVTFRVRHLGITWVNGKFGGWSAELVFDPANPTAATVTARIPMASVSTENERRDADIKANYFVVDSFPEMTFVSRRVEPAGEGHLRVTGDLTLRGITKPVVLETEVSGPLTGSRGKRIAFSATTTIDRRDFGILRNGMMEGAQIVGNDIRITIDVEATQPNG